MSGQKVQPTNFAALPSVKLDGQLKRVTYLFGTGDTSQLDQSRSWVTSLSNDYRTPLHNPPRRCSCQCPPLSTIK